MATIVQLKRSSVSGKQPDAANIQVGEPVVNLADQVVYTKTGSNAIIVIGAGTTSNISEGVNLYYTNARVTANVEEYLANASQVTIGNDLSVGAGISSSGTVSGSILVSDQSAGDEGGQIELSIPQTNTSLNGSIAIDIYQNRLRIFETSGTNRGVFIDLTSVNSGVGTNLIGGGSGTITSVAGVNSGSVSNAQLASGIVSSGVLTTANVSELTNLYYTNARAISAFTAGDNITIAANGLISANVSGGGGGGSSITVSNTQPVSPTIGDLWYQGNTGIFFIYYDNEFKEYSRVLTEYFNEDYEEESYDQLKLQYGMTQLADFAGTPANGDFITFNGTSFGPGKSFLVPFRIVSSNTEPARVVGTVAVADNSGWDPNNNPGSDPYLVFYNGTDWFSLGYTDDQARAAFTAGTGVSISSGTIAIDQNVASTASVEFRNLVLSGNLTVTGTSTIAKSSREIDIHDPLIYLNEPISANVINAVGNGSNVTYTLSSNHIFQVGEVARVTGITPSALNQISYTTIVAVSSNTVTIAKATTNAYVSGGVLESKVAVNPDIGFSGGYTDGSYSHAGLFRDATDGRFKFFDKYDPEPDASIFIDITDPSFRLGNVEANLFVGNVSSIANHTTDSLSEGSTNIYFSNARVIAGLLNSGNAFPSGTKMLFVQNTAPTGWTKDTTHNDKALRVVSGSVSFGGNTSFTAVFTGRTPTGNVGNTTLTAAQSGVPAHSHTINDPTHTHSIPTRTTDAGTAAFADAATTAGTQSNAAATNGASTGITINNSTPADATQGHNHAFTGNVMDFAVQYVDVIIATKD